MTTTAEITLGTRVVERMILAGDGGVCPHCDEVIKFTAKKRGRKVIANVYGRDGHPEVWDRVEHFHRECYIEAGQPYGPLSRVSEEKLISQTNRSHGPANRRG